MGKIGLILLTALVAAFTAQALVAGELVTQNKVGKRACGPTALFYAFKYGNDEMRAAYNKLTGDTDDEKLKYLLDTYGSKPSKVRFHKYRYDASDGTAPADLLATANDLLKDSGGLQSQILFRGQPESETGSLLKRIHGALRKSLTAHVPIVSIILPYVGTYVASQDVSEWSEHNGHYVVVTSVPEKLDDDALGFTFKYLDPETGKTSEGYLYEEAVRHFWARKDNPDGSADWIHPSVTRGQTEITSPYLSITAPGLALVPPHTKDAQRVVLALTTVIGHFADPILIKP